MVKNIILVIVLLVVATIYYWLKKKRELSDRHKLSKVLGGSDYHRLIITIPPLLCLDCGNCSLDSKGCCSHCVSSVNFMENKSTETHCHEHNHDHKPHTHSNQGGDLILMPMISGIITYRIIKKVGTWIINKKAEAIQ